MEPSNEIVEMGAPRLVQIKLRVADIGSTVGFYKAAFGFTYLPDISSFQFGTYPGPDFFLLTVDPIEQPDTAGSAEFGLLVTDVDQAHRDALAAGASESFPPQAGDGTPRVSGIVDPDGNHVELFQAEQPTN